MKIKGFVFEGKFIPFVERYHSSGIPAGMYVIRMHCASGKTILYKCRDLEDRERKMKQWEPLCYATFKEYRKAGKLGKFEDKLVFKGFAVNDVVTVKQEQNAYYTGKLSPGNLYIIRAFPPKLVIRPKNSMIDSLQYFAYLESADGELTGGVNICNLEPVHRPGKTGRML